MTVCARCGQEEAVRALDVEPLAIEVGASLVPEIDPSRGGIFPSRVEGVRREIAAELGLVLPPVAVRDAPFLGGGEYRFLVHGYEVARGQVLEGRCMVVGVEALSGFDGHPGIDPSFGLPVVWIPARDRVRAASAGLVVVDAATLIMTHFGETVRRQAHEILSYDGMRALLDACARRVPALVADAVPRVISPSDLLSLLRGLLRERVCVRDVERILESVLTAPSASGPVRLALARRSLARWITQAVAVDGVVHAAIVDDGPAAQWRAGVVDDARLTSLEVALGSLHRDAKPAVVLAPSDVRATLFERLRVRWSPVYVLAPDELDPDVRIVPVTASA